MRQLSLFIHPPVISDLRGAVPAIVESGLFSLHILKLDSELFPLLIEARPCVCIFSLTTPAQTMVIYNLLEELKELRLAQNAAPRDPSLRVVLIAQDRHIPMENWVKLGVHELVIAPVAPKALAFKLSRHYYKALSAEKRLEELSNAQATEMEELPASSTEWRQLVSPSPAEVPVEVERTFKAGDPTQEVERIVMRVRLPNVKDEEGVWLLKEAHAEGESEESWIWRKMIDPATSEPKGKDLVFTGDQPEYEPEHKLWRLSGEKPRLYLVKSKSEPEDDGLIESSDQADGSILLEVKSDVDLHTARHYRYSTAAPEVQIKTKKSSAVQKVIDEAELTLSQDVQDELQKTLALLSKWRPESSDAEQSSDEPDELKGSKNKKSLVKKGGLADKRESNAPQSGDPELVQPAPFRIHDLSKDEIEHNVKATLTDTLEPKSRPNSGVSESKKNEGAASVPESTEPSVGAKAPKEVHPSSSSINVEKKLTQERKKARVEKSAKDTTGAEKESLKLDSKDLPPEKEVRPLAEKNRKARESTQRLSPHAGPLSDSGMDPDSDPDPSSNAKKSHGPSDVLLEKGAADKKAKPVSAGAAPPQKSHESKVSQWKVGDLSFQKGERLAPKGLLRRAGTKGAPLNNRLTGKNDDRPPASPLNLRPGRVEEQSAWSLHQFEMEEGALKKAKKKIQSVAFSGVTEAQASVESGAIERLAKNKTVAVKARGAKKNKSLKASSDLKETKLSPNVFQMLWDAVRKAFGVKSD